MQQYYTTEYTFYCSMVSISKNTKTSFQDFCPGHFFGHLFLSFSEKICRLSFVVWENLTFIFSLKTIKIGILLVY